MTKKIGTHDGVFHADDVFAIAALRLTNEFRDSSVVRTRDLEKLATCDARVDVGGKYNPITFDFDHHQKGGASARQNGVPYAAFGLIWRQFGEEICEGDRIAALLVDERLVQAIDASDTGYSRSRATEDDTPRFSISAAISEMNPAWDRGARSKGAYDVEFALALHQVARTLLKSVIARAKAEIEARNIVRAKIGTRGNHRLLILDHHCPWGDVVVKETPDVLYVVFPSETGDWRVQAVQKTLNSFELRKPLPEAWAGKSPQELAELTGVPGFTFCHNKRFIAAVKSKQGALEIAELALTAD